LNTVIMSVSSGVGTISLNRPERHNALDDETADLLASVWDQAAADDAVRVIVVRGEGPSFCSGRDTAVLGVRVAGESDMSVVRRHQRTRIAQLECPKPVIAAVKGYVLGGGLEMALAADVRIGTPDVTMAFPEIKYGLMTDTGGSSLATALAGPSRAKLMLMTGRRIDAATACQWGLLDEIVPVGRLDAAAAGLAAEIAANPPQALAMIKETVNGMWQGQIAAGLRAELLAQVALFGGEDYRKRRAARLGGE
jgi:enoyl-CoA hydratase/carnithine racemase